MSYASMGCLGAAVCMFKERPARMNILVSAVRSGQSKRAVTLGRIASAGGRRYASRDVCRPHFLRTRAPAGLSSMTKPLSEIASRN